MEERIIDDEFGKGVRLKKNKDGDYVIAEGADETDEEQETSGDEISFEFPTFEVEEGEEDLIGLSPEEVEAIRLQRAEEAAARRAEYEALCVEGKTALEAEKLEEAVEIYGKALTLDEEPTEASVGYWTAKTKNFTEPDVLVEEYKEMGVENMEFDLGYQAAQTLKEQYGEVFQKRYDELVTEEKPLREEVEGKRENRRAYIKARLKKTGIIYGISLLPLLLCLALALVLGGKIPTVPDNRYVAPTIVFAVLTVAFFIVSIVCLNRFWLAFRINRINEDPESTDEGARLVQIEQYKELYEYFLK